ncbi:hypothetical protein AB5I41_17445 [Sphingomonas sp. MMS24-JH45]
MKGGIMDAIAGSGPIKMPVVQELDGVRAIAVVIVDLSHCPGFARFVPGGLGVTIFFFLSISSPLCSTRRHRRPGGSVSAASICAGRCASSRRCTSPSAALGPTGDDGRGRARGST